MKKFHVKITDKKTNQILEDIEVLSNGEKYLKNIYSSKYKFHSNKVSIEITRMRREPGKQIDLEEMIKDCENETTE